MSEETETVQPRTPTGKFAPKAAALPPVQAAPEAQQEPDPAAAPPPPSLEALNRESVVVKGGITADISFAMPEEKDFDPVAYKAEIERIKGIRKPLGEFTQKLALPQRRGYKRHWFNATPGRVEQKLAEGWAAVTDSLGRPIKRVVGTGRDNGALIAYALEIPVFFFQEYLDKKHEQAKAKMEDIRTNPVRAKAGTAKKSDAGKFYSPKEDMVQVIEDPVPQSQF